MNHFAIITAAVLGSIVTSQASAQYIPPPVGGGTIVVQPSPTAPIPPPVPMGPRY